MRRNRPTGILITALVAGTALAGAVPAQAADRTPPSVKFMSPGGTIAVAASKKKTPTCQVAAKDKAGVKRVDFFVALKKKSKKRKLTWLGRSRTSPFRCKWTAKGTKPGKYTLMAKATDGAGNEGWGQTSVTVRPTSGPVQDPSESQPTSTSAGSAQIGISAVLRGLWGQELDDTIGKLRRANIGWSREDMSWSRIETKPGEYDWSNWDRILEASARQGLRLIAIPDDAPDWATGAWNNPPTSGEALQAYAEFVRRAVERYGSTGTFWDEHPDVPKVPVTMWDIWNEPYMKAFWKDSDPEPALYAKMFKAVVQAARPADSEARFMLEAETGSNTGSWPQPPFLDAMFDAVPDLADYADVVSVHPYTSEDSPTDCTPTSGNARTAWQSSRFQFCRIRDIRKILDANGASRTRIWITEVGYTTAPNADRTVSEAKQADYLRAAFRLLRQWRVVDGIVWYELRGGETSSSDYFGYYGLLHKDGSAKPAWNAFVDEAAKGVPAATS
jgi:Bacterial Ig domain